MKPSNSSRLTYRHLGESPLDKMLWVIETIMDSP